VVHPEAAGSTRFESQPVERLEKAVILWRNFMSEPYLGEIRPFAFNFPPVGWAYCDGSLMDISQNEALYSLVTVTFGGNGETTFGVPDFRGRAAMGPGTGPSGTSRNQGDKGGDETVTLSQLQLPQHTHNLIVSASAGNQRSPVKAYFANEGSGQALPYSDRDVDSSLGTPIDVRVEGGSQPHNNLPPYLAVNFCICLDGIYPSRP
jgi:microcystin-dependent protein